jgi:hypothetical protein
MKQSRYEFEQLRHKGYRIMPTRKKGLGLPETGAEPEVNQRLFFKRMFELDFLRLDQWQQI